VDHKEREATGEITLKPKENNDQRKANLEKLKMIAEDPVHDFFCLKSHAAATRPCATHLQIN
jgi:hypothetical protein